MSELLSNTLVVIYGVCGIVTFIGFVPTMIDLWNKKPSANIRTYVVWVITMFITTLYAVFINKDLMFIGVASAQLIACIVVLVLRLRLNFLK